MDTLIQKIEHEIALLIRLTTAHSPKLGQLDRSGYLLLSKLDHNCPIAINVLADELKLNLSTASRQIAALESKGFVRRFPDQKNGRISLIEITAKGQEIFQKVQQARRQAYAEILHDWTNDQLEQLGNSLSRLNQSFITWDK
jgi:DNA-binding MarR family transcriptional regulator